MVVLTGAFPRLLHDVGRALGEHDQLLATVCVGTCVTIMVFRLRLGGGNLDQVHARRSGRDEDDLFPDPAQKQFVLTLGALATQGRSSSPSSSSATCTRISAADLQIVRHRPRDAPGVRDLPVVQGALPPELKAQFHRYHDQKKRVVARGASFDRVGAVCRRRTATPVSSAKKLSEPLRRPPLMA